MPGLEPTPARRRLEALDALRGFALLGVLVVNVHQAFSLPLSPADHAAARLVELLGEGSFYPAFSLLFGLGFALGLERGWPTALFRRRLLVLLGFGLAHGLLVWHGDILASYALAGFLLPGLARLGRSRLLRAAAGLYAASVLLFLLLAPGRVPLPADLAEAPTYGAALELRVPFFLAGLLGGLVVLGGQLLAFFAFGLSVGRRGVARLLGDGPWLRRTLLLCLGVALPFLAFEAWGESRTAGTLGYLVGSPFLGFAYLLGLALLQRRVRLPGFAAVGRLALSNYLLQSVVGTLLFYGYGLGLYGKVGTRAGLLYAGALFLAQVFLSRWWLERFRYGPAEWLWRSLTYGRAQPFRRAVDPAGGSG